MKKKSKKQVENIDKNDKKLLLSDVSKSLPCECGSKKFWKFSNKQVCKKCGRNYW